MGMNSGPSGKRYKRGYRLLIKAGVENAMAKGYLFGRPVEKLTKRAIMPSRGKVIWPDPPKGFMKAWWRATQTGRWEGHSAMQRGVPWPVDRVRVHVDIEAHSHIGMMMVGQTAELLIIDDYHHALPVSG